MEGSDGHASRWHGRWCPEKGEEEMSHWRGDGTCCAGSERRRSGMSAMSTGIADVGVPDVFHPDDPLLITANITLPQGPFSES